MSGPTLISKKNKTIQTEKEQTTPPISIKNETKQTLDEITTMITQYMKIAAITGTYDERPATHIRKQIEQLLTKNQ